MENKLISMTDYVLEHPATTDCEWQLSNHLKYAKLLKQPLKKGMFVPCDEDDNVLNYDEIKQSVIEGTETWDIWINAEENVLFDGFELIYCVENTTCISNKENDTNILFFNDGRILLDSKEIKEVKEVKTIEDLTLCNLTLINK